MRDAIKINTAEQATTKLLAFRDSGKEVAHVDENGVLHIDDPGLTSIVDAFRERDRYREALERIAGDTEGDTDPWDIARAALKGDA